MDCNKEEAIRAKELAEKKMQSKDFVGARKIAVKAQQLYPELKDISQMILVCDVHCAAQNKIYGSENDWYAILQVAPTDDEVAIKKQYRKLALLLHPDKNQFAGASDAFKFIGEAQKVLLDNQKRGMYDNKYKAAGKFQVSNFAPKKGSRQSAARAHPWFQSVLVGNAASKFTNEQSQQQKVQSQPMPATDRLTFWTVCPYCSVKYQYYKDLVNKPLTCQTCDKQFTGFETSAPPSSVGTSSSQAKVSPKVRARQGPSSAMHSADTSFSVKTTNQGSINVENIKRDPCTGTIFTSETNKEPVHNVSSRKKIYKSGNNKKRRSKSAVSSESCETMSSTDIGEDDQLEQNSGFHSAQNLRRSTRSRHQVSYDEYLSDDAELGSSSKKSRPSDIVYSVTDSFAKDDPRSTISLAGGFVVPDPDFNNFDAQKSFDKFQEGQIWAMYSDEDALPKYYGIIKKIDPSPNFGLHVMWLAACSNAKLAITRWADKNMPISCGKFKVARKNARRYENASPFSHHVKTEVTADKNVCGIFPDAGDVWALYKGWNENIKCSDLETCEYEIVEVLDANAKGFEVLVLELIKEFKSVFKPQMAGEKKLTMLITWKELYRFSHQIPAVRLSEEKEGSLRGFWELDTAALPVYFFL